MTTSTEIKNKLKEDITINEELCKSLVPTFLIENNGIKLNLIESLPQIDKRCLILDWIELAQEKAKLQAIQEIEPIIRQEVIEEVCEKINKMIKRKLVILGVKVLNENTPELFSELLEKGVDAIPSETTPEEVERRWQIKKEVLEELKQQIKNHSQQEQNSVIADISSPDKRTNPADTNIQKVFPFGTSMNDVKIIKRRYKYRRKI